MEVIMMMMMAAMMMMTTKMMVLRFEITIQFCQVCQLWFHPSSSCRGANYKVFIFSQP